MRVIDRFMAKVSVNAETGCWLWLATLDRDGYGRFHLDGSMRSAHRVAFELLVGPIPEDRGLDHLCRVRRCVNPDHLEPVTQRENVLRGESVAARHAAKTACVNGHPFDEVNTYFYELAAGRLRRSCRACPRERRARAKAAS